MAFLSHHVPPPQGQVAHLLSAVKSNAVLGASLSDQVHMRVRVFVTNSDGIGVKVQAWRQMRYTGHQFSRCATRMDGQVQKIVSGSWDDLKTLYAPVLAAAAPFVQYTGDQWAQDDSPRSRSHLLALLPKVYIAARNK